jgi:hypothetical protein
MVARFDQEQPNIRAALACSLDSVQTQAALQLLYHLWFYWSRHGFYQAVAHWAIRAIHEAAANIVPAATNHLPNHPWVGDVYSSF